MSVLRILFFFFQAEDGIRDSSVTGVQTCALPIWEVEGAAHAASEWAAPSTSPSLWASGGSRCGRRDTSPSTRCSSSRPAAHWHWAESLCPCVSGGHEASRPWPGAGRDASWPPLTHGQSDSEI